MKVESDSDIGSNGEKKTFSITNMSHLCTPMISIIFLPTVFEKVEDLIKIFLTNKMCVQMLCKSQTDLN